MRPARSSRSSCSSQRTGHSGVPSCASALWRRTATVALNRRVSSTAIAWSHSCVLSCDNCRVVNSRGGTTANSVTHAILNHPNGIQVITGQHITGKIELSRRTLDCDIHFEDCTIDVIDLTGSSIVGLRLNRCSVGSIVMPHARVSTDVVIENTEIGDEMSDTVAFDFAHSRIDGNVLVRASTLRSATRSVDGTRARVEASIRLHGGFQANGVVRLLGSHIGGSLNCDGANFAISEKMYDRTAEPALILNGAQIGGSVFLRGRSGHRLQLTGGLATGGVEINGQLRCEYATIVTVGAQRIAMTCGNLRASGGVVLWPEVDVEGQASFPNLNAGSHVELCGVHIVAAGDRALDLGGATIEGTLYLGRQSPEEAVETGRRSSITGGVRLSGAKIRGNLDLADASIRRPGALAVAGGGCTVGGTMQMGRFRAIGGVRFAAAAFGGSIEAASASVYNPDSDAIVLDNATVTGDVTLDRFRTRGTTSLVGSRIAGRLVLANCVLRGSISEPAPWPAAVLANAKVGGDLAIRGNIFVGRLNLVDAEVGSLRDEQDNWPSFNAGGLRFARFAQPDRSTKETIAWLEHQSPYDAGLYETVAGVLRSSGHPDRADAISVAGRRRQRPQLRPLRRWLERLWDVTLRYGTQPWRVIAFLLCLILGLTVAASVPEMQRHLKTAPRSGVYDATDRTSPTGGCSTGESRCFHPVYFAIDTVVPIVDLGQRATWHADGSTRRGRAVELVLVMSTLLGWASSTLFALSFTRLVRSD